MLIVRQNKKQRYSAMFDTKSGFFARVEEQGAPEPTWCEFGPELMDIAITNWCDRGCSFCYRRSDTEGVHMPTERYRSLMNQAARAGVFQVALGGGNPNQHPDFCDILAITRREFGIVPSYTTNGRGLSHAVLQATRRYCGGVAVSAYAPYSETAAAVRKLARYGIKTNIHFILSSESVDQSIDWLRAPPDWLREVNALIFLNFKPVTRDANTDLLAKHHPRIAEFFRAATSREYPFRIGFDDCSTTGLITHGDVQPVSLDACDSARFSMFVSERMQAYPCSFMAELCEGHPVTDDNLMDIWRNGELFTRMRESLAPTRCGGCASGGECLSGCPLFPEMNICDSNKQESPVRVAMAGTPESFVTLTIRGRSGSTEQG